MASLTVGGKVDTLATLLGELCKRDDGFGPGEDGPGRYGARGRAGTSRGFGISNLVSSFRGLSPRKRSTATTQRVLKLIDEDDELEEELAHLDSGSNLDKLGSAGRSGSGSSLSIPGTPGTPALSPSASPLRVRDTFSSDASSEASVSSRSLATEKLRLKRHREYRQLQRIASTRQAAFTSQSQQALHDYVGSEARELGGAAFTRFMNDLYTRVFQLVNSTEPHERLGGVRAIDALIDVSLLGENATKISRFANYLRDIFQPSTDAVTLAAAAKALGHLVHSGGPVTADVVEFEVKRALEWLQGERVEYKRLAAVLILKELAKNSPTVFNVHVAVFIRSIWSGLRDPKLSIRRASIAALRACLVVVEKRETRYRVKWYYELFEETKRGARKGSSGADSVHGSLLVIGELLRHTGEFMLARYREVVEMVLQYRDSRERIIRSSVVTLLPRIASFAPERFAQSYLEESMTFLLNALKSSNERSAAFAAIGHLAQALGHASFHATKKMEAHLPSICATIRDVLVVKKGKKICVEAIECVGALALGLGLRWKPYCISLLDTVFNTGMSSQLVSALEKIVKSLPELMQEVRDRLLQKITQILYRKETQHRIQGAEPTCLALRTLGIFDFGNASLLEFVKSTVLSFLDDPIVNVRQEAALTCCDLLEGHLVQGYQERNGPLPRRYCHANPRVSHGTLEVILGKLLMVAITDIDPSVRTTVLMRFKDTSTFDKLLAQADMLQASFNALNDEAFSVREMAIELVGRLAGLNPAYVLPALRRLLLQLLTDLEYSADSKHKEDSARLLGNLIDAAPRLVLPYVSPVLKSLVNKLKPQAERQGMAEVAGSGETGVAIAVLSTIGKLALVGGSLMRSHVPQLLPLLIGSLQDSSSAVRRDVAVSTMGDLIESTGYVVQPYTDYPQLLGVLLRLLNESSFATRHKLIKLLGILGSFDPHEYKVSQSVFATEKARSTEAGRAKGFGEQGLDLHDQVPSFGLVTSSDEYYPTVAINVLMQVLHDGSMKSHHLMVIRSLMFIFQALGIKCVQYLPKVMPVLFHVAKSCDEGLRQFIFQQFTVLVSITKQHLGKYLDDILALVQQYWGSELLMKPILQLLEQLSHNFHDEFRTYLPQLLPRIVTILADAERRTDYTYVPHVLHAIESFGSSIEDNLHILLPALMRLISPNTTATPLEIRRTILESLARILKCMKLSGYGSAIVQPLARILSLGPESLKRTTLDTICAAAVSLGEEFSFFVPSIRKLLIAQNIHHDVFEAIASCLALSEPPCTVDTVDYNASTAFDYIMKTKMNGQAPDKLDIMPTPELKYSVNEQNLKKAWESSQRSTKEDWVEWMRHFSVELLKESPSPALRACYTLAQVQPHTAKDLFAAGFISCWSELSSNSQQQLIRSLEAAFNSPTIPTEIVTSLLNLAEFMEHDGKPLQVDYRMLGALAERCHAFAKALHYKEMEFQELPESCVEALISIYNQLNQPDAAVGVLANAQQELQVELKESWYEKLQQWDEALEAYRKKQQISPAGSQAALEAALGCLRCLAALAEWEELSKLCRDIWLNADVALRRELAPTAAHAAWHMGQWTEMAEYVSMIESSGTLGTSSSTPGVTGPMVNVAATSTFLHAVLKIHEGEIAEGLAHIEQSRELLATELTARVGESYERAYGDMVRVQQLVELEEVIEYSRVAVGGAAEAAKDQGDRRELIRQMWHDRLWGVQRNVEVWQALLSVRSLVLPVSEDSDTWLKFASLCRKSGRLRQSKRTLIKLLNYDPGLKAAGEPGYGAGSGAPKAMYAYCKYLWSIGNFQDAYVRLQELSHELSQGSQGYLGASAGQAQMVEAGSAHRSGIFQSSIHSGKPPLQARVCLKRGLWHWSLVQDEMDEKSISEILSSLRAATESARGWSKAWHHWALFNVAAMEYHSSQAPSAVARHVAPAVLGFFRSIALSQSANGRRGGSSGNLQDILRLLTLWFNHGDQADVEAALIEGFGHVSIDTWLLVIPQIIARIHTNSARVRQLIQSLFMRIGRHHPQALMYPLLVACKSSSSSRRAAAMSVLDNVRQHSATLVEQAQLVSQELIRMAVLWHEMWHEALEDASRLYFGENNVDAMLNVLLPLHVLLEKNGPETLQEIAFIQAYGRELQEAHEWCNKYRVSRKEAELHQAWDLYYHVFKRINKQLPSLTTLQLQYVAPALVRAQGLELAVPGTYVAGEPVVTISSFAPQLNVITSKQRPRKLTIHGGDGSDYVFLLKGHEDLRQDERVMQLFGLVNTLLRNDRNTSEHDLSIARYSVTPLSPNSGLIGWVPNCDTLHTLIREFREARKIPLNIEHRLMMAMAPDYEHLPLINKVEVFEHALNETTGDDLAKVLWLKSRTSEVWLDRRTNYTRSLAVMSVVGYILGLGDRHPSNLMLDRHSGKILHIDFGDCFEASMNREKFPEKVPFRLTRMLVQAMGVSGVEGNYRSTSEKVMLVLRSNKDSVMAMLEAFVHDPLINWRLLQKTDTEEVKSKESGAEGTSVDPEEVLNERAVAVMKRLGDKLTGRDFSPDGESIESDSVPAQVQRLIQQATSHECLCQNYIGWCPFW